MTNDLKFEAIFSTAPANGGDFDTRLDALPAGGELKLELFEFGGVRILANREGFLHLSRFFAELALRDLKPGWEADVMQITNSPDLALAVERLPDES